ncbi:MAG: hypothetical protein GY765_40505 [bacterium]|nr:hypothetical protein [bacterium]
MKKEKTLGDIERKTLQDCCDFNDNLSLNLTVKEKLFVYKSRFLKVDFDKRFMIIDEPSAETPDAQPLSKGESFEIFFTYKTFRYLFPSRLLEKTRFSIQGRSFLAFKIRLPEKLEDGDRRDFFRVPPEMRPPVVVTFQIYRAGSEKPLMAEGGLVPKPMTFRGEMTDISGGGFSVRTETGKKQLPLEKGDLIDASFKLKRTIGDMEIWSEVRNKRKYKDTDIMIWGMQFIDDDRNKLLKTYQNKLLRYVTERQREMIAQ